jgi:hypothetical protein
VPQKCEIDCEVLVLLERPTNCLSKLKVYQLPACCPACIVHPSDEEDIFAAKWAAH